MALLFVILAALAFTHFLYEGILAPSLRFELRLKLFALRDELRDLKLKLGDDLSDEVFRDLQNSINGAVMRLNQIDLGLLKTAREAFERDEKLRRRVERRIAMLEACPIEEVRIIRSRHFQLLDYALLINSGGWIPYLIPIVFGFIFADNAKTLVKTVFSLPENDLNRIVPPPPKILAPA